ncbi:NACHT domain-containing protein [Kutzneria buriramensis]|uniref:NACHT domain-containing protein n=1 Tax=Kutzneria buriramensis TaxID=1045776 RepID=A0A3E0HG71_9PSEU|nr:NACHT domain-containing protein [Kutzneria buriramensis]REH43815.1 NACHT domain-containing protein [Kutzneria buriramensis]
MAHDDDQPTPVDFTNAAENHGVQANIIHGDVHIGVPEPKKPMDGVWSLLRAQVQAAQELPRMLPGARRPALADVYVRQDLGSGVDTSQAEPTRPTPILDGHGQLVEVLGPPKVRIAVRPPARTVREALDLADHLVVTGGAGQGKSTLSLRLAAEAAARWLDGAADPLSEPVFPLRLTARALAARLHMPFADALADSVRADYGALLHKPVSAGVLSDRVNGCRWLLLVDGLDEVADGDDRDRLVQVLAAAQSPYRVVLTTRPIEGAVLAPLHRIGAVRYELQSFDDEALRRFATNWFAAEGPELADRLLRQIRAAHLEDMVRVPLLATIAAIVFQQRIDLPLPDNQYELYEAYFSFLRASRPADSPFEPHRVRLLERLGVERAETDSSLVTAARQWIRDHVEPSDLPIGWPDRLTEFLVAAGPLVIRGDDMVFLHHSFAEHLAATAAARELPAVFDADHEKFARLLHTAQAGDRGRHARAVALHYTRLHPDQADAPLRSLHVGGADQHLLMARLLAGRMPASTDVVDAFLVTVRDWAATDNYRASDILYYACRATQHPGLAGWLTGVLRDESLPTSARTTSASALAERVRGEHEAEALQFLLKLVENEDADIDERLTAAEALSESGTAERGAAERGLRTILDDPNGTGDNYRTAAVLLATFDGDARDFAVAALTCRLDDPAAAPTITVEAANGLIEIGAEFHTRAIEAFRVVLHDPVHNENFRGDAALGIASLGPTYVEEAASALAAVTGDLRRTRVDRISAAKVLGRLGPQYRQAAGDIVLAMFDEPDFDVSDEGDTAAALADFGPTFRDESKRLLRALIANPSASAAQVITALGALGKHGPEHLSEVAQGLWAIVDETSPNAPEHITALGQLAALPEPDRSAAIRRLRALLVDPAAPPERRCQAATPLIDAGPEFHAEVAAHMRTIADTATEPNAAAEAWDRRLDVEPHCRAEGWATFLRLFGEPGVQVHVWLVHARSFAESDRDRDVLAGALIGVAQAEDRSLQERQMALFALFLLGTRFYRRAMAELGPLFRSVTVMDFNFVYLALQASLTSLALRRDLAGVLYELLGDPRADISRLCSIVQGLEQIGFADGPEVIQALHTIVDHADDIADRLFAQRMLLAIDPAAAPAVANDVLAQHGYVPEYSWTATVDQLAQCGVDLVPRLRIVLTSPDVDGRVRRWSARYLHKRHPEHRAEALAEVHRQLTDSHSRPTAYTLSLRNLTAIEPAAAGRALDEMTALLTDERLKIVERCNVAKDQTQLDRSSIPSVLALLQRLIDNSLLTPGERRLIVDTCRRIDPERSGLRFYFLAAAAEESTNHAHYRSLRDALPRGLRTHVERNRLADRTQRITRRLPQSDRWGAVPLVDEATAEIREVMTAPEFSPTARIDAALALARLDIRTVPEMTAYLEDMRRSSLPNRATTTLIKLRTARGREVLAETERVALDTSLPLRTRRIAADTVLSALPRTPPSLVTLLREVADDATSSWRVRSEALSKLPPTDGVTALRALRDNEAMTSVVRRRASGYLLEYRHDDRAANFRLLRAIAADPRERPALRWRAAEDLAARGREGREAAVDSLREMAHDEQLPVSARARAAEVLGDVSPNTRREVLAVLRSLLSTDKPLLRLRVLLSLGDIRPQEAALELMVMAKDGRHGPVVRVRCADAAVRLRPESTDGAAAVVRTVANDDGVPWHVRRKAACYLARWSEVCREEARQLIRRLDDRH